METVIVIVLFAAALVLALGELRRSNLKNKQIPKLKETIVKTEERQREEDEEIIEKQDIGGVVVMLNSLHTEDGNDTD